MEWLKRKAELNKFQLVVYKMIMLTGAEETGNILGSINKALDVAEGYTGGYGGNLKYDYL